ncbi:hypothetical protein [Clostridium estertheticum]|uniref:hypothetical protein n=1 Tax=Clostridium estertheticum TaxID=238834 RepID=UPI0021F487A9|nr:hypothetical protein [Clostridium estertheticum]
MYFFALGVTAFKLDTLFFTVALAVPETLRTCPGKIESFHLLLASLRVVNGSLYF